MRRQGGLNPPRPAPAFRSLPAKGMMRAMVNIEKETRRRAWLATARRSPVGLTRLQLPAICDQLHNRMAGKIARTSLGHDRRPGLAGARSDQNRPTVKMEAEDCDALFSGVGPRAE